MAEITSGVPGLLAPAASHAIDTTGLAGYHGGADIAAVPGGGLAAWTASPGTTNFLSETPYGTPDEYDVYLVAFDGRAVQLTTPEQVSAEGSGYTGSVDLVPLDDDRLLLAWGERDLDGHERYYDRILARTVQPGDDPAAYALGDSFTLIGSEETKYYQTRVVAGESDELLVTWTDDASLMLGQIANLEGGDTAAFEIFDFGPDYPYYLLSYDAIGLSSGDYIVAWDAEDSETGGKEVFARRIGADGTVSDDAFRLSADTESRQTNVALAALPEGGFLAAWNTYSATDNSEIAARLFDDDGTPRGPDFTISADADRDHIFPVLSVLTGGQIAVSWVSYPTDTLSSDTDDYRARLLSQDGAPLGDAMIHQQGLTLSASSQGGLFSIRQDDFPVDWGVTGDTYYSTLTLYEFPSITRFFGTPEADTITGSASIDGLFGRGGDDVLVAGAGDDRLYGGGGRDVLNGGDGDDLIEGGEGAGDLGDLVYAGAGHDIVQAGYGNDRVFGMGGSDSISGGFGADELRGQDGDDTLTGGALSDLVFGGAGDDFVNGGAGFDRVNGGAGADRFFHQGVAGHGSDWVQDYTAAEGDVLFFDREIEATQGDFVLAVSETPGAGAAGVAEAFVTYRPTGQILWALVDGGGQDSVMIEIGDEVFDLLA